MSEVNQKSFKDAVEWSCRTDEASWTASVTRLFNVSLGRWCGVEIFKGDNLHTKPKGRGLGFGIHTRVCMVVWVFEERIRR